MTARTAMAPDTDDAHEITWDDCNQDIAETVIDAAQNSQPLTVALPDGRTVRLTPQTQHDDFHLSIAATWREWHGGRITEEAAMEAIGNALTEYREAQEGATQ